MAAKLVGGDLLHIDATLNRADVSWQSLAEQNVDAVSETNDTPPDDPDEPAPNQPQTWLQIRFIRCAAMHKIRMVCPNFPSTLI